MNNYYYILVLSVVKRVDLHKTFSQLIYIPLGLFFYLKNVTILKPLSFIIIVFYLIDILLAYNDYIKVSYEYIQLVSLIGIFCHFRILDMKSVLNYLKAFLLLSFLFLIYYYAFSENSYGGGRLFFIPRTGGVVGEPNFSSFISLCLGACFLYLGNINYSLLSFFTLVFYQSRASLVSLIVFVLVFLFYKLFRRKLKYLQMLVFVLLVISPFVISSFYKASSVDTKRRLVKVSTRFYLTNYYSSLGVKKPLGVGLGLGRMEYVKNGEHFRNDLKTSLGLSKVELNEQHSLFNQILSEFGILRYVFVWVIIFWFVFFYVYDEIVVNFLIVIFTNLMFLNGINEVLLFISVGILYNKSIFQGRKKLSN